jgi:hypothetical protein
MPKFLIVCGGSGVGLLGQSKITGMQAELQLDVKEEIEETQGRIIDKSCYSFISLDEKVPTAFTLFDEMWKTYKDDKSISDNDRNHIKFLYENYYESTSLSEGLRQSPAIGGGTVRDENNVTRLKSKIGQMFNIAQEGAGGEQQQNVFWIISSTAGGTGEGVHRFVGEQILEYCLVHHKNTPLFLNFIRVGPGTYQTVNGAKVNLNTFFGLAADASFEDIMLDRTRKRGFGLTTKWFYTELPDVGSGSDKKPLRAEIVEIAAKTFMLEELQEACDKIFNNVGQAVIRTSFWGCDFDSNEKLYASLKGLKTKLTELKSPNYMNIITQTSEPQYNDTDDLQNHKRTLAKKDVLINKMENDGWKFYKDGLDWGDDLSKVDNFIENVAINLETVLEESWFDKLKNEPFYSIRRPNVNSGDLTTERFEIGTTPIQNNPITEEIKSAHLIKAWAENLLGRVVKGKYYDGLVEELRNSAEICNKAQYGGFIFRNSSQKAAGLAQELPNFLDKLVKVKLLLQQYNNASSLLEKALHRIESLYTNVLEYERKVLPEDDQLRSQSPSIIPADLDKPVPGSDGRPWIEMLLEAVEEIQTNPAKFYDAVISGATHLTRAGLRKILGLDISVSDKIVKEKLNSEFGAIQLPTGIQEGRWWGGNRPDDDRYSFNYRIFPELEATLGEGENNVSFLYSNMGNIGLNVLAVEACSFAEEGDKVSTPKFLMNNYCTIVKDCLEDWDHVRGKPSGKYKIALAGNFFDPLLKPVLVELGFNDEEMNKLNEFFEFHDPADTDKTKV